MRLSALESVKNAAEDLIKQATDNQDEAVQGLLQFNYHQIWWKREPKSNLEKVGEMSAQLFVWTTLNLEKFSRKDFYTSVE